MSTSLERIVAVTGGTLEGSTPSASPGSPAAADAATANLTNLLDPADPAYAELAPTSVVVLPANTRAPAPPPGLLVAADDHDLGESYAGAVLRVADTRLALARLSSLLGRHPLPRGHDGAPATVHPSATVAADAVLAPGVVVGAGASVGAGCVVGANSVIGEGVTLGEGCLLHPNVTLYPGTRLGRRVTLHAGAVIGADGFGYAAGPRGAEKIVHLGGVVLGDDVEVGANTAIDRGTLLPTRVGDRTKIDNHCQIGHNVVIGSDTLIAGMTGVAGSARIGRGVILGGYVAVSDHVQVGDGARIAGRSGVTKDVPPGATWAGFPARPHRAFVRELYLLGKLEQMWQAVKPRRGDEENV